MARQRAPFGNRVGKSNMRGGFRSAALQIAVPFAAGQRLRTAQDAVDGFVLQNQRGGVMPLGASRCFVWHGRAIGPVEAETPYHAAQAQGDA